MGTTIMDFCANKRSTGCVTLEALLDSPNLSPPSPLIAPMHVSDMNKTSVSSCSLSVDHRPNPPEISSNSEMSAAQCLSSEKHTIVRDICMELISVLKDQDVNGHLLFPLPFIERSKLCPKKFSLLAIEKRVALNLCTNVLDFQKEVMDLCSHALSFYHSDSVKYQEVRRLANIAQDWFSSIAQQYLTDTMANDPVPSEVAEPSDNSKSLNTGCVERETNLHILNPDNKGIVNRMERVQSIGDEAGQLQSGSNLLPNGGYREDRRNKIIPYTYLDYGPFYSFGPTYDSGASHCTPESNRLVLGTTWLPARTYYVLGDQNLVRTRNLSISEDDSFLSDEIISSVAARGDTQLTQAMIMGQSEYKATQLLAKELDEILPNTDTSEDCVFSMCLANIFTKEIVRQNEKSLAGGQYAKLNMNGETNLASNNLGDCDLDRVEAAIADASKSSESNVREYLDIELDESVKDIHSLYCAQYLRLGDVSQTNEEGYCTTQPSSIEISTAQKLARRLVNMAKRARPRDLVHPYTVRRAMGLKAESFYLPEEVADRDVSR